MARQINDLATQLAQSHERWSVEQVRALVHQAQDGRGITTREESVLRSVYEQYLDRMDAAAASAFRGFLEGGIEAYRWSFGQAAVQLGPWEPAGRGIAMDPTSAFGPVFISPAGEVVLTAEAETTANLAERADAMYRLARLVDDIPGNLFAPPRTGSDKRLYANIFGEAQVGLERKGKLVEHLQQSLAAVPAGAAPPEGLDADAALQLRSSSMTVLLHLIESLPNDGEAGELKARAFDLYRQTLHAEDNRVLRESMVFNLYYLKDSLPADLQPRVEEIYQEIAPVTPPYDEWFKDGNNTLKVSWRSGVGDKENDDFLKRDTDAMVSYHGFRMVSEEWGHRVLEKEFNVDGIVTKVVVDARVNSDTMFDNMDDPDVGIVGYSGHSDLGRNIRNSLRNGDDQQGAKLLFVDLCSGKDGLFRMREKYPDAHVVTTFDSSYYGLGEAEGSRAFHAMLEGIAARKDWQTIDGSMKPALGWGHALATNYLTPVHTLVRRRLLDRDHDGQADVLDRLCDFSVVKVAESTAREFQPVRPSHPAAKLDGTNVHVAALTINTLANYNEPLDDIANTARVVADGWFVPREGEEQTIVRFVEDGNAKNDVEGRSHTLSTIRMQVNSNYAHMSEEALRAVACYEFIRYLAEKQPDAFSGSAWPEGLSAAARAKLMGLVFAGSNLVFDMTQTYFGLHRRDGEVWNGLLAREGLPAIDPQALFTFINGIGSGDDFHHDYTGSPRVVKAFMEMLTPEQLEAING